MKNDCFTNQSQFRCVWIDRFTHRSLKGNIRKGFLRPISQFASFRGLTFYGCTIH